MFVGSETFVLNWDQLLTMSTQNRNNFKSIGNGSILLHVEIVGKGIKESSLEY